jgi:hypothetical protein
MPRYFGRVYEVTIEFQDGSTRVFDGITQGRAPLQVTFSIDQTPSSHRAYGEISIYGLSKKSRRDIYERFSAVTLKAGYREQYGTIFAGSIENVEIGRDGPNTFLTLFCQSGAEEWPDAKIKEPFGKNTPYKEIIRAVAETFGYPVSFIGDFDLGRALKGKNFGVMDSKAAMRQLARGFEPSFDWFLASTGEMLIVRDGADRGDNAQSFAYTPANGLIGSPEITDLGVNINVLLNPLVRVYDRYTVESETRAFSFAGVYYQTREFPETTGESANRVISVNHQGDFYGDTWQSSLEGQRLGE